MKKIIAVLTVLAVLFCFTVPCFAALNTTESVQKLISYYEARANEEKTLLEYLSLALIYKPLPVEYYGDKAENYKITAEEIENDENKALTAANLIIFAAYTNIKIEELAIGFNPVEIILGEKKADSLFYETNYENAICLAALFAVNAEFDREASVNALLAKRLPSNYGWADENGELDIPLSCFILSVLSNETAARANIERAYLELREHFLTLINENGEVIINEKASPVAAAMMMAVATDYGVDDFGLEIWKGMREKLLSYQHEDGYFVNAEGVMDKELTIAAFFGLSAQYDVLQSSVGKLVEGRGFAPIDFSDVISASLWITAGIVLVIFVVIFLVNVMKKGEKAREEEEQ